MITDERIFLRVADFDERQNPRRPKRPGWLKMFVSDLEDPEYLALSLTVRGFLADFQRLAADLRNQVPDDVGYIARRLNTQPAVAGKALHTCLTGGFISRFASTPKGQENSNLPAQSDSRAIPSSLSYSTSLSTRKSTTRSTTTPGNVTPLHARTEDVA